MTVNMDKDYEDIYENLSDLLKEICKFLETKSFHLSVADKMKADTLIERSKKQLQIIEKFNTGSKSNDCDIHSEQLQTMAVGDTETERYVDMTKNTVLPRIPNAESPLYESKCPFQDLPAKEASQAIKYGTLTKRRKVLNIIDVSTKIYAVIQENWLLIYNSSKDLKPDCALDLQQYEAKGDESDQNVTEISKEGSLKKNSLNMKMTTSFKVFDSSSQKKCYSFVATTHKDMLQWVVNINRRHDKAVFRTQQNYEDQNYEICQEFHDIEEENIYNEIEMPRRSAEHRPIRLEKEENEPPAIPEKHPSVSKYILPSPPFSYEQLKKKVPLPNPSEKSSLDAFECVDEEDQTYYELDMISTDKPYKKPSLEENKMNSDTPPPNSNKIVVDEEDTVYDNGLTQLPAQISNNENHLKSAVLELPTISMPVVSRKEESAAKLSTLIKTSPQPVTPKPKIVSPKPWESFKKHNLSKSPQISKNRSIRDSLKGPLKSEKKLCLEEECKNISPAKENSTSNNEGPQTSNIGSLKSNQGSSIVKIFRNQAVGNQGPQCSLETFSKNTKIETFQATPTKETLSTAFLRSPPADIDNCLRPIESLLVDLTKTDKNQGEKPMVLLKSSSEEEESSKKLKKSPVIPVKPKKVVDDRLRPIELLRADLTKTDKNEVEKPMVLLKSSLDEEEPSKKLKKSPVIPVKPKKVVKKLVL